MERENCNTCGQDFWIGAIVDDECNMCFENHLQSIVAKKPRTDIERAHNLVATVNRQLENFQSFK